MPVAEIISFEKWSEKAWLKDPQEGFHPICQVIEIRKDPLTGKKCRINTKRASRPKDIIARDQSFENLIRESKTNCPFCPENIEKRTPSFVEGFPKRIKVNKCWIFPNHYPFARFHAVGVLTDEHYLEINQFQPKIIEDALKASLKYFKTVNSKCRQANHWYFNWNHLPPGAASIVHPHVQIFADTKPTPFLRELIECSRNFYRKTKSNFWKVLVKKERKIGERFIGGSGSINWLASYAPQGNNEVTAIFDGASSLADVSKKCLTEFCWGLSKILNGYHELGVRSFNMSIFSAPYREDLSEFYLLNARLVSRPNPTPFYTSDIGFMEKFHGEPVIEKMPEEMAKKLTKLFTNTK